MEETLYSQGLFIGMLLGYITCDILHRILSPKIIAYETDDESESQDTSTEPPIDSIQETFETAKTEREKVLQKALEKPKVSDNILLMSGKTGYVSNSELEERSKKYNDCKLSKTEEINIINSFRDIEGMKYVNAYNLLLKDRFSLRVLYVNDGGKKEGCIYDATVIGVKIKDKDFDWSIFEPSPSAIITQIIDVGGVDTEDRGLC